MSTNPPSLRSGFHTGPPAGGQSHAWWISEERFCFRWFSRRCPQSSAAWLPCLPRPTQLLVDSKVSANQRLRLQSKPPIRKARTKPGIKIRRYKTHTIRHRILHTDNYANDYFTISQIKKIVCSYRRTFRYGRCEWRASCIDWTNNRCCLILKVIDAMQLVQRAACQQKEKINNEYMIFILNKVSSLFVH